MTPDLIIESQPPLTRTPTRSYLFTNNVRSVSDLMPMIGARFYTQLDALQTQCDIYQDELAKDMENGRLYRLLVKLNFINERPE